jgi:hypothetical protein
MSKGVLTTLLDLKNGFDREMTSDEEQEFYMLAQAYNQIMPWIEYKYPVPHKERPMYEYSIRDTYNSLVERRSICEKVGIKIQLTYSI